MQGELYSMKKLKLSLKTVKPLEKISGIRNNCSTYKRFGAEKQLQIKILGPKLQLFLCVLCQLSRSGPWNLGLQYVFWVQLANCVIVGIEKIIFHFDIQGLCRLTLELFRFFPFSIKFYVSVTGTLNHPDIEMNNDVS